MSLWNQESEGRFPRCSSTWTACFATTKSLLENPTSICLPRWASKSPSTILWHLREQRPPVNTAPAVRSNMAPAPPRLERNAPRKRNTINPVSILRFGRGRESWCSH
ncbi:uncharacterized protein LOC128196566 isoform X2 [Vigna angularis]|uniref:uncharacterized protein LOC128196566 isoform X2 n=1 Tax=Phaseolus angularis TaxID=3914 RepID=UPI0022B5BC80|nr:uncharacterized protein LOC128196566 isoform X2 [Vigna angularis]